MSAFLIALIAWGAADQFALERYAENRQAHSISEGQFESVAAGTLQKRLLAEFGMPEEGTQLPNSCVTYKERGAPLLREKTFRFCFEGGRLVKKDFAPIEDPDLLHESTG